MARRKKAPGRARLRLLGKKVSLRKPVELGGGLYAMVEDRMHRNIPPHLRSKTYTLIVCMRTPGAGDQRLLALFDRETLELAVRDTERCLTRIASALRQAGAG